MIKRHFDCLIIGNNDLKFSEYEKKIKMMGANSGAYRDLNLNFITYNNQPYSFPDLFNYSYFTRNRLKDSIGPYCLGNTFSNAVAYLFTYIHKYGFFCDYINSFQLDMETMISKLKDNQYHAIVIPTTLYVSVIPIVEIIQIVKKYNKDAKIILGGPFVANNVELGDSLSLQYVFKSIQADYYVYNSQGEATLVKILHAIKNNVSMDTIPNVYYKKNDSFIINCLQKENNSLEENMIDWELFGDNLGSLVSLRTAISCPFSCLFCEYPKRAGKYRYIGVEAIEQELNILARNRNITSIGFIDDTFNFPNHRYKDILKMMIKNRYTFKWYSYYRCQFADEETVQLMKESGCEGVILGIESGSPMILKNMNKHAVIEQFEKGLQLLNKYNIISEASFIIGFIGETAATVNETIAFIENCKPTYFRAQPWYCSTLSPIWGDREKYNIKGIGFEWSHETMDSKTAMQHVEDMIISIKNSMWIPVHNFDFPGIINLLHRGIKLDTINNFIGLFDKAIREKIVHKNTGNVTKDIQEQIDNFKWKV